MFISPQNWHIKTKSPVWDWQIGDCRKRLLCLLNSLRICFANQNSCLKWIYTLDMRRIKPCNFAFILGFSSICWLGKEINQWSLRFGTFHTHQAKCYSCQAWFKPEYELLRVNFDLINITLKQAGYSLDTISVHIVASFEKKN